MKVRINYTFPNPKWAGKIGEVVKREEQENANTMYTVKIGDNNLLFFENEITILEDKKMSSKVMDFYNKGLLKCPAFVGGATQYEAWTGSEAYGVATNSSDIDIYGFCIPPKELIFPHLSGEIQGFGRQIQRFNQYQEHHVNLPGTNKEYDFSIYNIIKYFQLTMMGNPNMADSLFIPQRCILHITKIGTMVRENRKLFLSKKMFHTYRGYAYSQNSKMSTKQCEGLPDLMAFEDKYKISHTTSYDNVMNEMINRNAYLKKDTNLYHLTKDRLKRYEKLYSKTKEKSRRAERVKIDGCDFKFGYHLVRLLNQIEQVLIEHDMDLERNKEQLKSIRRGEWTKEQIQDYFTKKENELETLYNKSTLNHSPDEKKIKELLLNCLEEYYGSLDGCISTPDKYNNLLSELRDLMRRYN